MVTETYRGRKIQARKGREWGTALVTVNGEPASWPTTTDLQAAADGVKSTIDFVDSEPFVNGERWAAYWYAPGTYELCDAGLHPRDVGGRCRHATCRA